jgi:hypothetical protein
MSSGKFNLIITTINGGSTIQDVYMNLDCHIVDIVNIFPSGLTSSYNDGKLFITTNIPVNKITIPITGKFERVE